MPLPLPAYESLGEMIQNSLAKHQDARLREEQIKNALIKNKFAEPTIQADIESKKSNTAKQNILNELPFAGRSIPGAGGEALGLQMIKDKFGEDSPVYQNALNDYKSKGMQANQLMNYRQALTESLPKRTATSLAKTAMEERDIQRGFLPGTNEQVSPERQKQLAGRFELKNLKDTTDPKLRERVLYAKNMEKTIGTLNPDALTYYSGPQGRAQLGVDIANSAARKKDVPAYKAYKEALTSAKVLAKQVRQFYGDSITPQVQEQLTQLADPTTWYEQPDVAKARYEQFINILRTEADTFHEGLVNADIYKKPENAKEAIKQTAEEFKGESLRMQGPDGKVYNVPQGKAQRFVENGFKRIG
jgi:hypothetical protein